MTLDSWDPVEVTPGSPAIFRFPKTQGTQDRAPCTLNRGSCSWNSGNVVNLRIFGIHGIFRTTISIPYRFEIIAQLRRTNIRLGWVSRVYSYLCSEVLSVQRSCRFRVICIELLSNLGRIVNLGSLEGRYRTLRV